MVITVQNILTDALGLTGVIAIDETPSTSELNQALRVANMMLGAWSAQRLLIRSTTHLSFPTVAGTETYTIAPSGAAITAIKPIRVYSAFYRDSQDNDRPMDVVSVEMYNNLVDKLIASGPPEYLSYDPGMSQQSVSTGTISLYPSPDEVYTIKMEVDGYLTEFVNLSDTITFEQAYYEPLVYNLGERLFRYYRDAAVPVPQDIARMAHNSLNNLRTMNSSTVIAACDLPGKVTSYNIYSDQ